MEDKSEFEKKELHIRWPADTGVAVFANNVTLQSDASGTSYLTFYQVIPPVVAGDNVAEQIKNLTEVDAKVVAKIAVTRTQLKAISAVIQRHAELE